jgi:hypothetical protein
MSSEQNENKSIDYKAVLADLETKRAELDAAIAAVRRILGHTDVPSPVLAFGQAATQVTADVSDTLRDDSFFGLSLIDAAKKYLRIVRRKKPTMEIVQALERGGFTHTSKNFYGTVFTALARESEKTGSEIVKVGKEWGISEWYPGMKKKTAE